MTRMKLTLACWDYDRTRALADGRVSADGIDLNFLNLPVEETFLRMLRFREFDVAEMSMSSYSMSLMRENPSFVAIPVFPSRCFRHGSIFVSSKGPVRTPADLVGKRIGVPEYQMTASFTHFERFQTSVRCNARSATSHSVPRSTIGHRGGARCDSNAHPAS